MVHLGTSLTSISCNQPCQEPRCSTAQGAEASQSAGTGHVRGYWLLVLLLLSQHPMCHLQWCSLKMCLPTRCYIYGKSDHQDHDRMCTCAGPDTRLVMLAFHGGICFPSSWARSHVFHCMPLLLPIAGIFRATRTLTNLLNASRPSSVSAIAGQCPSGG